MRKIINPYIGKEGYDCFACCPDNPYGLRMEFYEDGDDIVSFWRPDAHYQGWSGVMHGGILATLVDEVAGWVVTRKRQTTGVTSRMNVQYKKPLMADEPQLTVRAHIVSNRRNIYTIAASIANAMGEVCVEAELIYFTFDAERARSMGFCGCEVEDEQLLPL